MARIWLRADASVAMGLGHLVRAVALAQAARELGHTARLVTVPNDLTELVASRYGLDVLPVDPERDEAWLVEVSPGDAMVLDGYHLSSRFTQAATSLGVRCVVIDDFPTGRFSARLVVNPSWSEGVDYDFPVGGTVLLGPRYAPIRAEFLRHRRTRVGELRTLLVTLGGTDVGGLTAAVVKRLAGVVRLLVVVGPGADRGIGGDGGDVEVVVDPPDVAAVFARADAAVSAAGSTTWELLAMGLPTVLIQTADNQAGVVRTAVGAEAALFAGVGSDALDGLTGAVEQLSVEWERIRLNSAALGLVDGRGAQRIIGALMRQ